MKYRWDELKDVRGNFSGKGEYSSSGLEMVAQIHLALVYQGSEIADALEGRVFHIPYVLLQIHLVGIRGGIQLSSNRTCPRQCVLCPN